MAYHSLLKSSRKYSFAGIGVVFLLFISLYIIYLLLTLSERFVGRFVNVYLQNSYGFTIPGLGILIILAMAIMIGFMVAHLIGKKLSSLFEAIFMKVPLVTSLYPSAKQLSDFLFRSEREDEFKKVVLVEFPYEGPIP